MIEILNFPVSFVDNSKSPFSSDDVLSLVHFPSSSRSKMSAYGIPISDASTILPAIILCENDLNKLRNNNKNRSYFLVIGLVAANIYSCKLLLKQK